mmetsp:Transcript_49342/g.110638  ORF Transcript_49342/g.110638 Transcript_49342/m.110638 type:complete len:508 (-) Transcript_49342:95-1618(-)
MALATVDSPPPAKLADIATLPGGGPQSFESAVAHIPHEGSWEVGAEHLRQLIRSKALLFTHMRTDPARFFEAHKILADRMLGGFGVRFTVQFNLFAGSIIAMGSPAHVKQLEEMQDAGALGCFALTEVAAGVNSGLVVETTCTWNAADRSFTLNTPNAGARKNWISQGLAADFAVVIATLIVDGTPRGPHAFLMRLRNDAGGLVAGVEATDMGRKTTANELDNAALRFNQVRLTEDSLLDRFAGFDESGKYATRAGVKRMGIEVIGQRLLTGRLVIAQAQLVYVDGVYRSTCKYAAERKVWHPVEGSDMRLKDVPHVADMLDRCGRALTEQLHFCSTIEKRLHPYLKEDKLVPEDLAEAISVAKICGVETAIKCCQELQNDIGSHALMAGTGSSGYLWSDILQCAKFAEGDSRVLMQKMARDRLRKFQKKGMAALMELAALDTQTRAEASLCFRLGRALRAVEGQGQGAMLTAWNNSWRDVYALARLVCNRHQQQVNGSMGGLQSRL